MSTRLHGDRIGSGAPYDFAVNVWPSERTPRLRRAMQAAVLDDRYPDQSPARRAVARRHGRRPDEVLLANGACEVFWLLAHALRPRRAACVHPSFTEPHAALEAVGASVATVLRDDRALAAGPRHRAADAEIVVVGNPNNPTGALDDPAAILALCQPQRLVVVDESFMDFVPDERTSLASCSREGLAVVRSLTKIWSLAGVRAGYMLGPCELVARLEAARQPWPVNSIALAAIEVCAPDRRTPARVASESPPSERSWCLRSPRWKASRSGRRMRTSCSCACARRPLSSSACAARSLAVRPAADFPGLDEDHIRIAVRRRADNERLVAALATAVARC